MSTSLPVEAPHAQLDTKTHQVVIQHSYVRHDQDKPVSPAEIERKLNESNRISENMLALLPRILVARSTLDNLDHSLITIAFRGETDAAHCKTLGAFFGSDYCYTRGYIEMRRINRYLTHIPDMQLRPQTKVRTLHQPQHSTLFSRTPQVRCKEWREGQ